MLLLRRLLLLLQGLLVTERRSAGRSHVCKGRILLRRRCEEVQHGALLLLWLLRLLWLRSLLLEEILLLLHWLCLRLLLREEGRLLLLRLCWLLLLLLRLSERALPKGGRLSKGALPEHGG